MPSDNLLTSTDKRPAAFTARASVRRLKELASKLELHSDHRDVVTKWQLLNHLCAHGSALLQPEVVLYHSRKCTTELDPLMLATENTAGDLTALCALMPKHLRLTIAPKLWRFRTQVYRIVGDTVLMSGPTAPIHLLVDEFRELLKRSAGAIYVEDLACDSALFQHLHSAAANLVLVALAPRQLRWYADVRSSEYWSKFSSKRRYNLRRQARDIPHSVMVCRTVDDVVPFLAHAEGISKLSWQARHLGLRVRCNNDSIDHLSLHAEAGSFRSYLLQLSSGAAVAFVQGFQHAGRLFVDEVAYDPSYAKYSPGTVLLYRILEDIVSDPSIDTLDFGFGDAAYKRQFGTRSTTSAPYLLTSTNSLMLAAARLHSLSSFISRSAIVTATALRFRGIFRRAIRPNKQMMGSTQLVRS